MTQRADLCVRQGSLSEFIDLFKRVLDGGIDAITSLMTRFEPVNGAQFEEVARVLQSSFQRIRSSFVASTSGGALLHFVGDSPFPDKLFDDTDERSCRVHFEPRPRRLFYLIFSGDPGNGRYYFSPPLSLDRAVFFGPMETLNEKERILRSLQVSRRIHGISRSLILKLDTDWLEAAREQLQV